MSQKGGLHSSVGFFKNACCPTVPLVPLYPPLPYLHASHPANQVCSENWRAGVPGRLEKVQRSHVQRCERSASQDASRYPKTRLDTPRREFKTRLNTTRRREDPMGMTYRAGSIQIHFRLNSDFIISAEFSA